ncbi:MAG: hypothetical protein QM662_00290 [Gordonia sp. (in: high G+C Gram-positive bacteria)]
MTASVYVRPPTSGNPSDAVQGEQYARSLAQLLASLVPVTGLRDRVANRLGREGSPAEPADMTATAPQDAAVVNIVIEGDSVELVQRTGDALLAELPGYASAVRGSAGLDDEDVTFTTQRSPAGGPSLPFRLGGLAISGTVGVVIGCALVWLLRRLRGVVTRSAAAQQITGARTTVEYRSGSTDSARMAAAQLLAAAGPGRDLVLIGTRPVDGAACVVDELASAFAELADRAVRVVAPPVAKSPRPAVLVVDDTLQAPTRLARIPAGSACFVVVRPTVTRAADLSLLSTMMAGNGVEMTGLLVVRGTPRRPRSPADVRPSRTVEGAEPERDWPRIAEFEAPSARER